MALASTGILNIHPGGSDNNPGYFNPGATALASDLTATGGTSNAPVVSSASYSFGAGDVGALVYVKSGTNWTPGWYRITSVSAGAATLDATLGNGVLASQIPTTAAGVGTTSTLSGGSWLLDYSQQDTANLALSDVVTNGTTTVTSATGGFKNVHRGNGINVAGTVYEISSVTNSTTIVIDRTVTTATGQSGNVGGALGSPGKAAGQQALGNAVWLKSGATYLVDPQATVNTSGGPIAKTSWEPTPGTPGIWHGYSTSRTIGNTGTKPVLQASRAGATATYLMSLQGNNPSEIIENIELDGASFANVNGLNLAGGAHRRVRNLKIHHCVIGLNFAGVGSSLEVSYCSSSTAALQHSAGSIHSSSIHHNTGPGYQATANGVTLANSLIYSNTGVGANEGGSTGTYFNNTFYNNGGTGLFFGGSGITRGSEAINSVFYGNGSAGIDLGSVGNALVLNCAGGNNTGGNTTNGTVGLQIVNFVTLTANPFDTTLIAALTGTSTLAQQFAAFALNNTTGGGASLRGAGTPAYLDIGAVQSQASSSSSTTRAYAFAG